MRNALRKAEALRLRWIRQRPSPLFGAVETNCQQVRSGFLAIGSMENDVLASRYNLFQFMLLRFQSAYSRFKLRIPRFLCKQRRPRPAKSRAIGQVHGIGEFGGQFANIVSAGISVQAPRSDKKRFLDLAAEGLVACALECCSASRFP